MEEIKSYLLKLGNFDGFLHTDYKLIGGPTYHGNPIEGWQDQVNLIVLNVTDVHDDNHMNLKVGSYELVHFMNKNVLVMF